MATEKPTLGSVLLKLRVELDISQKELGTLLGGLDDSTISLWEAGKVKPYPKSLFKAKERVKQNSEMLTVLTEDELAVFSTGSACSRLIGSK